VVKKKTSIKYILSVLIGTFVIAAILGSGTEAFLRFFSPGLTWVLLIVVIGIGILSDIVGIAVTAADEAPHHARAAKKISGARQSVYLIKHCDRVSNFANDIVGDITGTLSGAMGATIVIRMVNEYPELGTWRVLLNVLLLAGIASCTVTGKAWGKTVAINEANRIVDITGRLIAGIEKFTGFHIVKTNKRGGK